MSRTARAPAAAAAPSRLRCALYTRKSSEEGLEQSFNSLHAQREACEAYVLSQAGEGWTALPDLYDDGGFSGGTMDRPGLQRLLADVRARRVDVVVVYKVDRLTRALADFAKIVDVFDAHGVSFVSVTQAFNTTTSMGRLTLNVLLSFAQFEREVTGERIRDKIAASKAKGMWMGGVPPLGYRVQDRALHIVEAEAEQVRSLFRRYLELGSVAQLREELQAAGLRSRTGAAFSRGALFHLLHNRLYRGEIVHKERVHPGLHPAIVDEALFEAVQASLAEGDQRREARRWAAAPLRGLVFDEAGAPMSPSFGYGRRGQRYRYYVSSRPSPREGAIVRVPAAELEELVRPKVAQLLGLEPCRVEWAQVVGVLRRVELRTQGVRLTLCADALEGDGEEQLAALQRRLGPRERLTRDGDHLKLLLPIRARRRGGRAWAQEVCTPVPDARATATLKDGLRRAHELVERMGVSPWAASPSSAGAGDPYSRKLYRLAFLAPDIQCAILAGRQPAHLELQHLLDGDLPFGWASQRRLLGFNAADPADLHHLAS